MIGIVMICTFVVYSVAADERIQTIVKVNLEKQLGNTYKNLVSSGDLHVDKHKEVKTPMENACLFYCAKQDSKCSAVEYDRYIN